MFKSISDNILCNTRFQINENAYEQNRKMRDLIFIKRKNDIPTQIDFVMDSLNNDPAYLCSCEVLNRGNNHGHVHTNYTPYCKYERIYNISSKSKSNSNICSSFFWK